MQVDDELEDDDVRETYNFAPGYRGMVFRADTPSSGARATRSHDHDEAGPSNDKTGDSDDCNERFDASQTQNPSDSQETWKKPIEKSDQVAHRLQAMQWGLIPFWTKRNPGFGSMIKTINCRDDSLAQSGGMWNTMKKNKRCIVVAQGFYEWLKKDGGKTKIPHFVKRVDEELMCFAGLWDCVQYEGSDEKLWTYTIITTEVNRQLSFLHDRMPVVLDIGSKDMKTWLDPERTEWNQELQSILEPYSGKLECFPVNSSVGKVGNNSPNFIVPVDSVENKNNIANFFGNITKKREASPKKTGADKFNHIQKGVDENDNREIANLPHTEDNAPLPVPEGAAGKKRGLDGSNTEDHNDKHVKLGVPPSPSKSPLKQPLAKKIGKKTRSAVSNNSALKAVPKAPDGSHKITSFFK